MDCARPRVFITRVTVENFARAESGSYFLGVV
jgi:hypothetical protein